MPRSCQSRLTNIQATQLQPFLAAFGYSRHSNLYTMAEPQLNRVIELHKSKFKNKGVTDFTFDCGIHIQGVIEFYCNQKNSICTKITDCCIHTRIGLLNDDMLDKWWSLREEDDDTVADRLVPEIRRRVEVEVIPFLNRFRIPSDIIEFLVTPRTRRDAHVWPRSDAIAFCLAAIVAFLNAMPEQARELIQTAVAKSKKTPVEETIDSVCKRIAL